MPCSFVKCGTLHTLNRWSLRRVFPYRQGISRLNIRIQYIALDCGHHCQGIGCVGIQFKKREDGIKKRSNGQTIGTENAVVAGLPGKMGVGQHDLVPMPHTVEGGE